MLVSFAFASIRACLLVVPAALRDWRGRSSSFVVRCVCSSFRAASRLYFLSFASTFVRESYFGRVRFSLVFLSLWCFNRLHGALSSRVQSLVSVCLMRASGTDHGLLIGVLGRHSWRASSIYYFFFAATLFFLLRAGVDLDCALVMLPRSFLGVLVSLMRVGGTVHARRWLNLVCTIR